MLRWLSRRLSSGSGEEETAAWLRAAMARQAASDFAGAAQLCEKILERDPDHARALYLLGEMAALQGRNEEAAGYLARAVEGAGSEPQYHYALGCVLSALGDASGAAASYERAVALSPGHVPARLNLGCLLQAQAEAEAAMGHGDGAARRMQQARAHFAAAATSAPRSADAWINLGYCAAQDREPAQAEEHYSRALELDAGNALARFNRSMVLLGQRRWKEGWRDYEARWEASGFPRPRFSAPEWTGQPLEGKTLLLYTEQGFGDAIQFARYARVLAKQGARVHVRCAPALVRLMRSADGVAGAAAEDKELPAFDYHCALLAVPGILDAAIPGDLPYFFPDPMLVRRWAGMLPSEAGKRVGLVWASQSAFPGAGAKSVPSVLLEALAGVGGAAFYSVQLGVKAPSALDARDLTGAISDFADTAALIKNLDLVVSVDTAVAHLAGALGKPVWTMLPYAADWRWEPEGEPNPWYPGMRLFRQRRRGDWREVLSSVREALEQFCAEPISPT